MAFMTLFIPNDPVFKFHKISLMVDWRNDKNYN